jgi:hypothetical protein
MLLLSLSLTWCGKSKSHSLEMLLKKLVEPSAQAKSLGRGQNARLCWRTCQSGRLFSISNSIVFRASALSWLRSRGQLQLPNRLLSSVSTRDTRSSTRYNSFLGKRFTKVLCVAMTPSVQLDAATSTAKLNRVRGCCMVFRLKQVLASIGGDAT